MTTRPPGYRCAKALRALGFDARGIAQSLRRRLALNTGEIEQVLSHPVTPPEGLPATAANDVVDLTDVVDRPVHEELMVHRPSRRTDD
jgi:hypothetical protein